MTKTVLLPGPGPSSLQRIPKENSTLHGILRAIFPGEVIVVQAPTKQFGIHLLFYVESPAVRALLETNLPFLTEAFHSFDLAQESFSFQARVVADPKEYAESLVELLYIRNGAPTIVVSDRFIEGSGDKATTTDLANAMIGVALGNGWACQSIALVNEDVSVSTAVTKWVNFRSYDLNALREAIRSTALRLNLLSPSKDTENLGQEFLSSPEFSIRMVTKPEELHETFRIRHRVYGILGYLGKDVQNSASQTELDFFDGSSLHFVAIHNPTHEVAATLRLILPHQPDNTGRAKSQGWGDLFQTQTDWFREIARQVPEKDFRLRLLHAGATPLPFLENVRPTDEWRPLIRQAHRGAEFSRLIVLPKYRGYGLSRALMHYMIAACLDLKRQLVFAECQPNHVPMYSRYGFSEVEGRQASMHLINRFNLASSDIVLDLMSTNHQMLREVASWNAKLFKLANPKIETLSEKLKEATHAEVERKTK